MSRIPRREVLKSGVGVVAGATVGSSIATGRSTTDGEDENGIKELGEAVTGNGAREVDTRGRHAFVASGVLDNGGGFTVVDWSDVQNPEVVNKVDVPGPEHSAVDLDDDILAVNNDAFGSKKVDDDRIGAHFYDVSKPDEPQLLGSFDVNPPNEDQIGAHNLFVHDSTAYLARFFPRDNSELIIVDISDPSDPTELSRWDVGEVDPQLDNRVGNPHQVHVEDDLAYLAYWDAGCRVLDVSDPENPVEVTAFGEAENARDPIDSDEEFRNRFSKPPGNIHSAKPTPDGEFVVLAEETGQIVSEGVKLGDIEIWDVTDFDNPVMAARIEAPNVPRDDPFKKGGTAHNFDIQGNQLHSPWYAGGVRVHDISDPYNPELLDRFDPEGTDIAYDTTEVKGRFTLVTRRTKSLVILDTGDLG